VQAGLEEIVELSGEEAQSAANMEFHKEFTVR
jgi:hypothetical protein